MLEVRDHKRKGKDLLHERSKQSLQLPGQKGNPICCKICCNQRLGWTARLHPAGPKTSSLAVSTPDMTLQKLVQLLILAKVNAGDIFNTMSLCATRCYHDYHALSCKGVLPATHVRSDK